MILFLFIAVGAVVGFSATGGAALGTAAGAAVGGAVVSLIRRRTLHQPH